MAESAIINLKSLVEIFAISIVISAKSESIQVTYKVSLLNSIPSLK